MDPRALALIQIAKAFETNAPDDRSKEVPLPPQFSLSLARSLARSFYPSNKAVETNAAEEREKRERGSHAHAPTSTSFQDLNRSLIGPSQGLNRTVT
jgi:hypothetical protein